ncbi:GNAT family N-acetyltransferase [Arthrobacter glacialis]|uniref:GNAT family N-acetyltransferase n=1 Tax=Arthrobacter glacialis TaxID=1664 RepID=A0A2S3ZR29_ARTGL|nr:GNAT family N-acetyltransferase [Arthrobacter glacialis]POH71686.1 GNAT family N-acetyltransferase [Arthrobacter glacialis]
MEDNEVKVREAIANDKSTLALAAFEAMNWNGTARFTHEEFATNTDLSRYLKGWPRVGDFGVVAQTHDGVQIGGAWCRTFAPDDAGYGFIAEDIPELTIGVLPGHRGIGAGTALMASLITIGRSRGLRAISLSVEDGNRARALYERLGFVKVGRNGGSDTMLLQLDAQN